MSCSKAGIYLIRCTETNEIYIGKTANFSRRWYDHRAYLDAQTHSNANLQTLWNEHGKAAFQIEILEHVQNLAVLDDREQYWLNHYHNLTPGLLLNRMLLPSKNGMTKSQKHVPYKLLVELSEDHLSKLDDLVRERQSRFPGAVRRVDVIRTLIEAEWLSMNDQGRIRAKSPA